MFDLGGLFGNDSGFKNERNRLDEVMADTKKIPLPVLERMIYQGYSPETMNYSLMKDDEGTKGLQLAALNKMQNLSETGQTVEDAAAFDRARNLGAQAAKVGTENAIQNARARGVSGSGMEFALREMANQGGAQRTHEAGLEQAASGARNRAMYNQAYNQALGNFRNQNNQASQANTDIINRFNQANTQNRNQAAQYNIENRIGVTRGNNQMSQADYDNQMKRVSGISEIGKQRNAVDSAEEEQRRRRSSGVGSIAGGIAGAYMGGPVGASAGAAIGGSVGGL